ncbi:hypothetical protein [Gelidibacter sp. F63206]|uniref:hypothetical protein n=1 Tax=Gelidibacter sp. F63206 TaxID=2926425 RepID=UPI001FF5B797|nr:hypothetical protein [Gelidibacter sp. F63206]MCK0115132.1 hypothetical protein [Gelidibacter sp. F63206]
MKLYLAQKQKMIIDKLHFERQLNNINQILCKKDFNVTLLRKMPLNNFKKEEILSHYSLTFQNFPLTIENSSNEIGISHFATEFFEFYYELVDMNRAVSPQKEKEILNKRQTFIPENNLETIEIFIDEFIHSLIYNYENFLSNTMKQHYFVGVNNEVKILLNILKRYKSILEDQTKQIDIFWSIRLDKKISDLVLEMLIEFIEQRLSILTISTDNINFESKLIYIQNESSSIEWNGSQQELCELILELEKKEWIAEIRTGDRRKFANSITKIFNLDKTKKSKGSNSNNSFYQLLKGEHIDNTRTYPFMEKENYEKKFSGILDLKKIQTE